MQDEMKLQDYIRVSWISLWKNKFLIAAVTLLFLLIGILYTSWQSATDTYYAKTTVYTAYGTTSQESTIASTVLTGYSDIIVSSKVCDRAESIIGDANITASRIKDMVSTSYNKSSTILSVYAYSEDPKEAIEVANAVAEAFVIEVQSIMASDRIQILDKADDVRLSSSGTDYVFKTILLFGIAGFALIVIFCIFTVLFTNKINCVEQCFDEGDDDVIGIIPYIE
jgi:capsular polysaccharide biosynthesis protein